MGYWIQYKAITFLTIYLRNAFLRLILKLMVLETDRSRFELGIRELLHSLLLGMLQTYHILKNQSNVRQLFQLV